MNAGDVVLTDHAITRYRERVKPALGRDDAETDLRRVLELVDLELLERPPWPLPPENDYLLLTEGICLAGDRRGPRFVVKTVMVNASMSPETRARRQERRRDRRAKRLWREKRRRDLGLAT